MKKLNTVKFLVLILFFCTLLVSCKAEVKEVDQQSRDYISYGIKDMNLNFQPSDEGMDNIEIYSALFDGLLEENESGVIVPVLLKSYSKSNDGLEYVLRLKEDIYWSNGTSITSKDVTNYFKQVLSQNNKSNMIKELYSIYGAKAYNEGKSDFSNVAITCVDDTTIKIRMNNTDEKFIKKLANPEYRLVKNMDDLKNLKESYKKVLYSGAYRIQEVNGDNSLMLKHNEKYWDKAEKQQDKIKVNCYSSTEMALADLQTNKIDLFKGAPISEVEKLYLDNKLQVYPLSKTLVLRFNLNEKNITSSIDFRRAIDGTIKYDLYNYLGVKSGIYDITRGDMNRSRKQGDLALFTSNNIVDDSKLKEKRTKSMEDAKSILESIKNIKIYKLNLFYEEGNEEVAEFIKNSISNNLKLDISTVPYKDGDLKNNDEYDMNLSIYDFSKDDADEIYKDILIDSNCKSIEYEKNKKIPLDNKLSDKDKPILKNVITNKVLCIPLLFENEVICKSSRISYVNFDRDGNIKLKNIEVK